MYLHAGTPAQCAQALVQRYGIMLLNPNGREAIAAVMRQRDGNSLYPSGEAPLKDIINDYTSLSGGDKWLLASMFLLVFRPVIQSTKSLVSTRFVLRNSPSLCMIEGGLRI